MEEDDAQVVDTTRETPKEPVRSDMGATGRKLQKNTKESESSNYRNKAPVAKEGSINNKATSQVQIRSTEPSQPLMSDTQLSRGSARMEQARILETSQEGGHPEGWGKGPRDSKTDPPPVKSGMHANIMDVEPTLRESNVKMVGGLSSEAPTA
ncbi:unnamed protein product [Linum trigynum]|uniref:Uncharacterized protein n=1 Tax=Linum trigynum TaxID=586398 RepID=A0AAV2FCX5_9ROSI